MSSINSIIDALREQIPTYSGFSTKKEMLNAYSIEDNPSTFLNDAWGIVILSGDRAESDSPVYNNIVTTQRGIGVVLCRPVYDVHGIGLQVNEEVKNLLTDAETIRNNFLSVYKFGVLLGGENVIYSGDDGVNFLQKEDGYKYIYTQVNFIFDTIETIN